MHIDVSVKMAAKVNYKFKSESKRTAEPPNHVFAHALVVQTGDIKHFITWAVNVIESKMCKKNVCQL